MMRKIKLSLGFSDLLNNSYKITAINKIVYTVHYFNDQVSVMIV